jgi:hypothetical protein
MRRIPRTKGAISGVLIILLGLWGGLVPFIGPYFNYAMHSDHTWQWFSDRFWLQVLPAAVAVIGGVIMVGGVRRASTSFGAMLALAAGLWFIVGPTVSMLWNDGVIVVGPAIGAHNITRTLEWLGFFYALGGLITMFSSYALGVMAALQIVDDRAAGRTAATGAAGAGAGFAAGRATAPRDREPAAPAREPATQAPATQGPATTRTATGEPTAADGSDAAPAERTGTRRTGGLFRRRRRETTTRT